MRHIGTIAEQKQAERFVLFLASQQIEAELRPLQETGYAVWVFDEERVATARQQLETFLTMPDDPQFDVPEGHQPRVARRFLQHRPPAERSRYIDVRTEIFQRRRLSPVPVTCLFIGVSVAVTLLAHVPALAPVISKLYFSTYLGTAFPEIRAGEVWRLVTPIFLHGGLLHLLFNMLWLYQLGSQIETQESSRSITVMVLVFASICNTAQYLVSGPLFVGMSGVVYGLLGYIWMMTRFQVGTRYMLSEQTVMFMLLWLGVCLVGIIPHVANTEHVVGLLLGVAWGFVRSSGWGQMRRRRRWHKQLS
jgi:rhomboid protease GlpG